MGTVPLGIIPRLRPLNAMGVKYLLFDQGLSTVQEYFSACHYGEESSSMDESPCAFELEAVDDGTQKNTAVVGGEQSVAEGTSYLPIDVWPDAWKAYFHNTPKNPRILWTYEDLGEDLSGQSQGSRRKLFQQIFRDIKLPKGSHAFWPLKLFPDTLDSTENIQIFRSGVELIAPEWLIFMTESIPEGLGFPSLRVLVPEVVGNRYVLLAPHVNTILESELRYKQLINFLTSYIHKIGSGGFK